MLRGRCTTEKDFRYAISQALYQRLIATLRQAHTYGISQERLSDAVIQPANYVVDYKSLKAHFDFVETSKIAEALALMYQVYGLVAQFKLTGISAGRYLSLKSEAIHLMLEI